ncbi:unnamed protein product, partial [Linum tenue]
RGSKRCRRLLNLPASTVPAPSAALPSLSPTVPAPRVSPNCCRESKQGPRRRIASNSSGQLSLFEQAQDSTGGGESSSGDGDSSNGDGDSSNGDGDSSNGDGDSSNGDGEALKTDDGGCEAEAARLRALSGFSNEERGFQFQLNFDWMRNWNPHRFIRCSSCNGILMCYLDGAYVVEMALGGTAPPRGSAAAAASMRRRRTTGGAGAGGGGGAAGGAAGTMLQFYTDDAPGLKISPNVVLFMSIGFIAFVAILHVVGKIYLVRREA